MKITETIIAWTSSNGKIEVGPWPDRTGWSRKYIMTCGACNMEIHDLTPDRQVIRLLSNFNKIVVRDGIDAKAAHKEFLKIEEYRMCIASDMEGAHNQYNH